MSIRKKLLSVLLLLFAVFALGGIGYRILGWLIGEDWTLLDSIFQSVVTVSTVGYDYLGVLETPAGRLYTTVLILFGIGAFFYGVSVLTASIVEMDLGKIWRNRKMNKTIEGMKNHFIVCGVGETGVQVVNELISTRVSFVAIDKDPLRIERLETLAEASFVQGDATDDEILKQAGAQRAAGLVAVLATDTDNLYVTLSARQLNPKMRIVAKCLDPTAKRKFLHAGAGAVVSPNILGGTRLASELIRPTVVKFLDVMVRDRDKAIRVEEAVVSPSSAVADKTIAEAEIQKRTGVLIVAANPPGVDSFTYSPGPHTKLLPGTTLIVLGPRDNIAKFINLLNV